MKTPENPNLSIQPRAYRGVEAETIRFTVPMQRSAPTADSPLTLECVRLAASGDPPGDPIVFLTGGPGISAIRQGEGRLFSLFDSLRAVGDVILLDQRGCGRSAPPGFESGGLALPVDRAPGHRWCRAWRSAGAEGRPARHRALPPRRGGRCRARFH